MYSECIMPRIFTRSNFGTRYMDTGRVGIALMYSDVSFVDPGVDGLRYRMLHDTSGYAQNTL